MGDFARMNKKELLINTESAVGEYLNAASLIFFGDRCPFKSDFGSSSATLHETRIEQNSTLCFVNDVVC